MAGARAGVLLAGGGKLLRVAKVYQDATEHHRKHPDLEAAARAADKTKTGG